MRKKIIGIIVPLLAAISGHAKAVDSVCVNTEFLQGRILSQNIFTTSDKKVEHRFVSFGEVAWSIDFHVKNYDIGTGDLKDYSKLQSEKKLEWGRILVTVSLVEGVPDEVYEARVDKNGFLKSTKKWVCDK